MKDQAKTKDSIVSPNTLESGNGKPTTVKDEKVQDKKEESKPKGTNKEDPEETKDKKKEQEPPNSTGENNNDLKQEPRDSKVNPRKQDISIKKVENFSNYILGYGNKNDKETVFIDPTKPLPDSFSQLASFKYSKAIESHIEKMKEKRLALLVCRSDDVLRSMAYTMVQFEEFSRCQKRLLAVDCTDAEIDDFHLHMFIDNKIGDGRDMVVLVEIEEPRGFFDSIFGETLTLHNIHETLRKKNILLICMTNTSLMQKVPVSKQESFLFHRWEIDFLPYLLEQSLGDEFEPGTLAAEILQQRDYGLWDRYKDDEEFYNLISGFIRRGKECFKNEVEKRREFIAGGKKPGEFWEALDKVNADDLFSKPEPHKTVLYTATFFNELTPIDFEKIVILMLKDRKKTVEKEVQVVSENNEVQTIKQEEEILLTDEWEKNADRILKDCGLRAVRADDLSQYIEFSYPYIRNQVKKHIAEEHPMYLRWRFATVQKSGILFSPDVSYKIIENVIRLSTEMALINPAHYGADWLIDFIFQMRLYFNIPDVPGKDDFEELLKALLAIANDTRRQEIYSRLSNLIREMLTHSQLRGMISNFLNKLIEGKHHEDLLEIVWEVGKRLRFAPNFDLIYWLKRLMEQGKDDIKDRSFKYLLELAKQSKFQIYELLDSIKAWLPREEDDYGSYSKPQKYALIFVLEYCGGTAFKFDRDLWGNWPSKYSLFYPLKKDKIVTGKRLKELIAWLLHPGLQSALDQWLPEDETLMEHLTVTDALAEIFEIWALILLGTDSQAPHPESREGLDTLVNHLFLTADKFQRKKIMKCWGDKRRYYRAYIRNLSFKDNEREELRSKYKIVSELISQFKIKMRNNKNIELKEVSS